MKLSFHLKFHFVILYAVLLRRFLFPPVFGEDENYQVVKLEAACNHNEAVPEL